MLLSNLNLLATAPSGVARLRELILTLAVQGKLVPQDPSDEPASELLKKIRAEKDRLMAEGKIKRDKPLAEITDDEKPFVLPKGWEWVRLQQAYDVRDGTHDTPKYHATGYPLVTSKNIYGGVLDLSDVKLISPADHEQISARSKVDRNDILFAMIGSIGNPVLVDTDAEFSVKNVALFKYYAASLSCPQYLLLVLQSEVAGMKDRAAGGVQAFVSLGQLRSSVVALPPLAEQSRIVTRVEELMRLCDALQAKGQLEAAQHAQLVSTLLATLTESETPEQAAQSWQRVATHFDLLLDRPEAIDALEQTILQLAVRGLLVPQNPQDEPASALLKKIRAEKDKLILEGKIKRDKPLPPIAEDEQPFELPRGWEWVRLDEVWQHSFYGPRFSNDEYVEKGGIPTIRTTDMTNGQIQLKNPPRVNIPAKKYDDYLVEKGDLLVTRSGSIGVMALFELDIEAVPSAYLIRLRFSKNMLPEYCFKFFMSDLGQSQLGLSTTSVGVPNVSASKMAGFAFPLPPLPEQHGIVTRVTELRQLCARLRKRLAQAQGTQQVLAQALVTDAG